MDSDEAWETLMNPDSRIVRQIGVEDTQVASTLFEQMMGANVTPRKEFLKEYSEGAMYNVE